MTDTINTAAIGHNSSNAQTSMAHPIGTAVTAFAAVAALSMAAYAASKGIHINSTQGGYGAVFGGAVLLGPASAWVAYRFSQERKGPTLSA